MRQIVLGFLGLFFVLAGRGQSFTEWFSQNSTRLKYYAEQITALKLNLGEMQKGYQVSDGGLASISVGKREEFDLHQNYYTSLENVNPAVSQSGEVSEINVLQTAIVQRFSSALTRYRNDGLFGADRLSYIEQVYDAVLQACLADAQTLAAVLKTGNWQMTDDQRMKRIVELDVAMRGRYSFALGFTDREDLLERQQVAERVDIGALMGLYGAL